MQVIAFDPGEHTAFIIAEIRPPTISLGNYRRLRENTKAFVTSSLHIRAIGQWYGIEQMMEADERGTFVGSSVFVIEQYVIYPNRANKHIGSQVYTAREIGRIEWIAHVQGLSEDNRGIVFQAASMAKQRWPQNRLKLHIGNYLEADRAAAVLRRDQGHIADAFRHLLTFFERNGGTVL